MAFTIGPGNGAFLNQMTLRTGFLRPLFGLLLILSPALVLAQNTSSLLISKNFDVTLFSRTPMEDVEAEAKDVVSVLKKDSREIAFQMKVRSFIFPRALMQEHFNENYIESDKFPTATFKGIIQEPVDFSKDGIYKTAVKGTLTMHGVSKERTIAGTVTIKNGIIEIYSQFLVPCKDHQIEIPKLVFEKIAEAITVTVKGTYSNDQKNK